MSGEWGLHKLVDKLTAFPKGCMGHPSAGAAAHNSLHRIDKVPVD